MASINGVSSSNMTSSLFNSGKVISGLASGLDTEGMIESLVQSYQTKINQLNQKVTKTEWKQEAYRSIIQKMVGFSNKYTSYTSNTNLTSPSFFSNAVKVLTKGAFADSVTASGKTSSDIVLNAVHQLATAAQVRTKSNMSTGTTGTIAGNAVDVFEEGSIELSNLSGSLTLTYGSKNVNISFSETGDVEAMNDIRKNLAKEQGVDEKDVKDADVLAGLINQKLADQKIVFNNGNSESADQRIQAVAGSDGTISFKELGTAQNGVKISGATGNIAQQFGLKEDDLKDSDKKITDIKFKSYDGLTRKMSGIDYMVEKGAVSMNMSLDGSTKQIKLPTVAKNEDGTYTLNGEKVDKSNFAQKYTDALSESVKQAFGGKVSVKNVGTDGKLQLEFKVKNEGSDLVINTDIGDALGIGKTATSYLNTGKTLGDLLGSKLEGLTPAYERDSNGNYKLDENGNKIEAKDSKGNPMYDFEINGVVVGSFSRNSSLSDVLSAINASDAGVKAAYSQTTQSFTFTAKDTGSESRVEFGDGLAQVMFGTDTNTAQKTKDYLGLDSTELAGKKFAIDVGGNKVEFKFNSGEGTLEQALTKINDNLKSAGIDAKASLNSSGELVLTDSYGHKVEYAAAEGDEIAQKFIDAPSKKGLEITKGQDALFTVTVNGEQKNMTRSSNSVNIDGLTINMEETFNSKATTEGYGFEVAESGKSVTFQNKTDSDKIIDAIKNMAAEYNVMMAEIKSAYGTMPYQKSNGTFGNYEPLTDEDRSTMSESAIASYEEKAKQGILFGDRNLSSLYTKMSQVFSFSNTRDVDTLKDMGLSLSYNISDGAQTLVVDEDKMRAYLDSNPDRVEELFTKTDGIMDRMKSTLDNYAKTTGEPKGILIQQSGSPLSSLSLLNNQWQTEIDKYNTQIEKWQTKLTAQVEKYTSQFSRLEQLINTMNSQSSALAGLMGG